MIDEETTDIDYAYDMIREYALSLPHAHEEFPWGESAIKVKGKTVVFLWQKKDRVTFTLKLTSSLEFALLHPFVKTMGPKLKFGSWVQCRFTNGETIPIGMLSEWILQSYRAVAPRKLAAQVAEAS